MIARVKIFSDFANPDTCKNCFERITQYVSPYYYGKDSMLIITAEENYTHAIILNTVMPELKIDKKNVLGLAFEPCEFLGISQEFIDYAKKYIGKYFIGNKNDLPDPFVERIGYMWHISPFCDLTYKPNTMSIILSNKKCAPGHQYRHELVTKIIELGLPIDIYGSGSRKYQGETVKGSFKSAEPYEKYMFTIAIENYKNNDYISEKIINPLMYNCKPIYWGANNILKYVSENDIILLNKNIDHDIELLKKILSSPHDYYSKTFNMKTIKSFDLILNLPEIFELKYIRNPYSFIMPY